MIFNLIKILVVLALSTTSGCVSARRYHKDVDCAYASGKEESTLELSEKTERLRKFNQIDEHGNLRPLRSIEIMPDRVYGN